MGNHAHTIQGHTLEGQNGTGFFGSGLKTNSASPLGSFGEGTFVTSTNGSGDSSETRPKTFVAEFYLRVN